MKFKVITRSLMLTGLFAITASMSSWAQCPEGQGEAYYGEWQPYSCPYLANSPSVSPTVFCQNYNDSPNVPTVVVPIYQPGVRYRIVTYDCGDPSVDYDYTQPTFTAGSLQWDPPLPTRLTNSITSTAYVIVTSSDINNCGDPGRVNIGTVTWCVKERTTNCLTGGFITLTNATISPTNGCIGTSFSASATKITSNAMVVVMTHCPCGTNADTYVTNFVAPTIVSNWWTVSVGSFSTNGTGLSASFTPTSCGNGTVTFNLTYKNATPCDTNVYAATPISRSFNVLSLNIVDGGGQNISSANSNNVVIVGQNIGLTAQTCGGTFSNFVWSVAGSAFSSYSANSQTGKVVTIFPLTNSSVSFYWKDGGSKSMSCSAVCGGVSCSTNVTFTVVRPTGQITTKTGTVGVNSAWGDLELAYGTPTTPGIVFSNSVTMPSGYYNSGNTNYDTEWVQIITSTLRRNQATNGSWSRLEASGVLDTHYPYPGGVTTSDSPGSQTLNSALMTVTISDNFDMSLMFRPSGGEWVPIRKVSWSWGGTATLSGTTWSLTASNNAVNPTDVDSTTHPTWIDNIVNHTFHNE